MSNNIKIGYMDAVDFHHELECASGGNKIYPSVDDLKSYSKCWDECGIVEVEIKLIRVIQATNFSKREAEAEAIANEISSQNKEVQEENSLPTSKK
jgi:cell division protein FtsX